MATAARMFGRLLVRELDPATLRELEQPAVRAALAELHIVVPSEADLDVLAHEWLRCFLHPPQASPPVHSLFRDGNYSGDAAVAVRRIAAAAGLEPAAGARNAPPDHIGSILLLWADLTDRRPDLARLLEREHMQWAERALLRVLPPPEADSSGFYEAVARATVSLVRQIREGGEAGATSDAPTDLKTT